MARVTERTRGNIPNIRPPVKTSSIADEMLKGKSTGSQYVQAIRDWRAGKIPEHEMVHSMEFTPRYHQTLSKDLI